MNIIVFLAFLVLAVDTDKSPVDAECIDVEKNADEIRQCCDIPSPLEMENIQTCKEKYQEELGSDVPNLVACIFDCHARELGVLKDDLEIDEAKMMEYVSQTPDEDVKKLMVESAKECLKAKGEIMEKAKEHAMKCHPLAFMMTECIMHAVYSECDKLPNHWKDSEICSKVKNGAEPCE
ncbi:AAEL004729-PA [Aedes aegypti]|uniref:AAEL004729-PA n=1 Tax=Aedes aegypti TaxID=7159 RepID=Q17C49_AEDAE|nr:AAEL004729-PA [Aedes aegypti]